MIEPDCSASKARTAMSNSNSSSSRVPGILIALGAVVFLGSGFTEVGGDVYSTDSADEIAAALDGARGTWDASNWIGAIGIVIAAAGLFMLGAELGRAATSPRMHRAASVVKWSGLATVVYLVVQIYNATASTEALADTYSDPTSSATLIVVGLAWTAAALAVFIGLGLALLWLPHQRWLGWFALVLGVIATVLVGAFLGPSAAYLLLAVAGIALAISPITAVAEPARGN
jgi:hypothetical protein